MHRIFKVVAALAVVLLLALAIMGTIQLIAGTARVLTSGEGDSERDPMFADEVSQATRPPELTLEFGNVFEDNSDQWVLEEENPVTMTAEDLAREDVAQ